MKLNNIFRLSAVALVALCASCSNEDIESSSKGMITKTFFATQGESVGTRTAIDANDKSLWSDGDAITVFDAAHANNKFTLSAGAGTNNGTFTGKVNAEGNQWYAIYPYNKAATISGNVVSGIALPTQQVAKAGQFDTNANILTASTTNENLAFKQVTCLVEVTTLAPASKIVFKSNGTEKLAGTLKLTIGADGVATYNVTANGSTEVSLVPADGQTSFAAGTYHLCILPQTLTQGITVEVYNADGTSKLVNVSSSSTDKFARGKVVGLGTTSGWDEVSTHECQHYYEFGKGAKEYVDLGLPSGLLWATTNLGAMEPWEYGDYYAWGATKPWLESYDQEGAIVSISQYCHWDANHNLYDSANAPYITYDLSPWSDAACQQWGEDWTMPIQSDYTELKRNAYWVWTDSYKGTGIPGYIVYKAKNDADKGKFIKKGSSDQLGYSVDVDTHIFFPQAGYISGKNVRNSTFGYWTKQYASKYNTNVYAYYEDFYYQDRSVIIDSYNGYTIRPVYNHKTTGDIEGHDREQINW